MFPNNVISLDGSTGNQPPTSVRVTKKNCNYDCDNIWLQCNSCR